MSWIVIFIRNVNVRTGYAMSAKASEVRSVRWGDLKLEKQIYQSDSSVISIAKHNDKRVVVKKTRITSIEAFDRYEKEVEFLQLCNHPNIIRPMAICHEAPNFAMVLPYASKASLHEILHLPSREAERHESGPPLGLEMAMLLALDAARAVEHLHGLGIVHRDIKPPNILLTENWTAQFIDLEISSTLADIEKTMIKGSSDNRTKGYAFLAGTVYYLAPELRMKAAYSPAADIYSLAITINEMLTGTIPFSDVRTTTEQMHTVVESRYSRGALIKDIGSMDLRPNLLNIDELPTHKVLIERVSSLIRRMWDREPQQRPTASALVQELTDVLTSAGVSTEAISTNPGTSRQQYAPKLNVNTTKAATIIAEVPTFRGTWTWTEDVSPPNSYRPVVTSGVISSAGTRGEDRMEDACVIGRNLGQDKDIHVYGCFDGHGGDGCSTFMAQNLISQLGHFWSQADFKLSALDDALKKTFTMLNARFLDSYLEDDSGSTACVCVIAGGHLVVANAGDCRAVLSRSGKSFQCSNDHTAAVKSESDRIVAHGGHILADAKGTLRVAGKIQVTRALGDRKFIKYGLSAEPEITKFQLTEDDEYLLIATDGVWDFVSNEVTSTRMVQTHVIFVCETMMQSIYIVITLTSISH